MSGHIDLDPEAIFYQHDTDGQLAPVKGRDVDPRRPFVLIPGEDGAFDQGDVLTLCEPCVAGLHESCEDGGETGCDCTDGACAGGEWVPLGMTTDGGQLFTAPAGTPPPAEPIRLPAAGPGAILEDLQRAIAAVAPRPDTPADNGPYVKSGSGPGPSPQVSALSRTEIERRRGVPLPGRIILPEALGGLPADAAAEPRVVPNRRERRAAAARMERRMRRG